MEQEIYNYLCENHVGRENIVTNRELRRIFNIAKDKTLRDIIKNIRKNAEMKEIVASRAGKDGGYWIADNKGDCLETVDSLKHRAGDMYKTAHIIDYKTSKKYGE